MTEDHVKSAVSKASRRLIPLLCLCYAINFLDRVNVGFAGLAMNEDLGFTPEVFGFGAGIFFVGYILFEIPSNLALARFGARIWIARIMIIWGLVATPMGLVIGVIAYGLRFAPPRASAPARNRSAAEPSGNCTIDSASPPAAPVPVRIEVGRDQNVPMAA